VAGKKLKFPIVPPHTNKYWEISMAKKEPNTSGKREKHFQKMSPNLHFLPFSPGKHSSWKILQPIQWYTAPINYSSINQ
jgi:hypothetical protein